MTGASSPGSSEIRAGVYGKGQRALSKAGQTGKTPQWEIVRMGNTLIILGVLMGIIGILVNMVFKGQVPQLPGDILMRKEHVTVYIPIVTSIVISVVLTILFHILRK